MLSHIRLVGVVFGLAILSMVGAIIGMGIGAIIFPMKVLNSPAKTINLKELFINQSNGEDQI